MEKCHKLMGDVTNSHYLVTTWSDGINASSRRQVPMVSYLILSSSDS